jgi:hypothetical protein
MIIRTLEIKDALLFLDLYGLANKPRREKKNASSF